MGQTKRSHVRARARWREQAMHLLATMPQVWVRGGARFDVALVRARCEDLLVEAERRAFDREVFADWTRDRGLGPENREPGAFVLSEVDIAIALSPSLRRGRGMRSESGLTISEMRRRRVGGWPGRLAREYGWERCARCDGKGVIAPWPPVLAQPWAPLVDLPMRPRCIPCKGRGRVRLSAVSPGVAAGPGIARTARRLLDTLEGRCPWAPEATAQPSECPACSSASIMHGVTFATADGGMVRARPGHAIGFITNPGLTVAGKNGNPRTAVVGEAIITTCPECRGTGHNLGGVLPEVEQAVG